MQHWVLIKGMKQDQRHWVDLPDRFREAFGGEVVCLDLPGVGTEVARDAPATVDELAQDLRARFVDQVGTPDGRWGVLGLSLGGMVAIQWAATHPGDFGGVVVGNTSAANVARPHWRLKPRNWVPMVRLSAMRDVGRRERAVLDLITAVKPDHEKDEVARHYARLQGEAPFTRRTLLRQIRAGGSFHAPERLTQPLLVLVGARDTLVDPRCSEALAARLAAPMVRHPEAGHDLSLDAPGWVVDRVKDWASGQAFQSTSPSGRK